MFEAELDRFNAIIEERTGARLELDRVLIRGHVPERYEAVRSYISVLDRCIAELDSWNEALLGRIENVYRDRVGIALQDDPAWALIRESRAWSWIVSMRAERDELARQLESIDELNEAPADIEADEDDDNPAISFDGQDAPSM